MKEIQYGEYGSQYAGTGSSQGPSFSLRKAPRWVFSSEEESKKPDTVDTTSSRNQEKHPQKARFNSKFCQSHSSRDLYEEVPTESSRRISINSIPRNNFSKKPNYGLAAIRQIEKSTPVPTVVSEKTARIPPSILNITLPESESDESHDTWKSTDVPISRMNVSEFTPTRSPKPILQSYISEQVDISIATVEAHEPVSNGKHSDLSKPTNVKEDPPVEIEFSKSVPHSSVLSNLNFSNPRLSECASDDTPWRVVFNNENPPIFPPFPICEKLSKFLDVLHGFRHVIDKYALVPKTTIVGKVYLVRHPQSKRFYRGRVLKIEGNRVIIFLVDFLSAFLIEKNCLREYPNVPEWMVRSSS